MLFSEYYLKSGLLQNMSSKIEYTIRNSIQELTNQKEQLYNYIDEIEYGIKILSIELPELLEEQFLNNKRRITKSC